MKIETPAEACACLAVLIAGADEVGTMEERRFLFENIAALPVFADFDQPQFSKLMEDATDWVWSEFPTDGGHITDDGVTKLVEYEATEGDVIEHASGYAAWFYHRLAGAFYTADAMQQYIKARGPFMKGKRNE